jgi:hypothetical protein
MNIAVCKPPLRTGLARSTTSFPDSERQTKRRYHEEICGVCEVHHKRPWNARILPMAASYRQADDHSMTIRGVCRLLLTIGPLPRMGAGILTRQPSTRLDPDSRRAADDAGHSWQRRAVTRGVVLAAPPEAVLSADRWPDTPTWTD